MEGTNMSSYVVTKVRMEKSSEGSEHWHIEGVCTNAELHYTRQEVVDSLDDSDTWETEADGDRATIRKMGFCPQAGCLATPYITTNADDSAANNLVNLPRC
jgi:hypothetical protein